MKSAIRAALAVVMLGAIAWFVTSRLDAAPNVTQIHPSGGSTGGWFVIAVLADGYPSGQETDFNDDAKNLFLFDLLVDSFYSSQASKFTIKTIFEAQTGSASNYGFHPVSSGPCDVDGDAGTAAKVGTLGNSVGANRVVVIGNDLGTASGCAKDNWTYVYSGSFGSRIVEHELGHLIADLYDEYVTRTGQYPNVLDDSLKMNCSTNTAAPWWNSAGFAALRNLAGCDLYPEKIIRPYEHCLMNNYADFCAVCIQKMNNALQPPQTGVPVAPTNMRIVKAAQIGPPTPPPPPDQNRYVSVLVRVNRVTGAATVEAVNDVTGPVYLRQQRTGGDYIYAVSDGGRIVATEAVRGRPFDVRGYRGTEPHTSSAQDTAVITVTIPFADKAALRTRPFEITFFRLAARSGNADITPQELARLQQRRLATPIARVASAALRRAVDSGAQPK